MNYIYNIFGKYFSQFKHNVKYGIGSLIRTSDSAILGVILSEVSKIVNIVNNRQVSTRDIPKSYEFPTSSQWNDFLERLDIDIDKLFSTNKLMIDDVQSLVNYNSEERENIIERLTNTQTLVYKAYVKSKKGLIGTTIFKEDLSSSREVFSLLNTEIDGKLGLERVNSKEERSIIDINNIRCRRTEYIGKLFPNKSEFNLGSRWKIKNNEEHFDINNTYIKGISDLNISSNTSSVTNTTSHIPTGQGATTQNSNNNINLMSSCQFESVHTHVSDMRAIIKQASGELDIPEHFIINNVKSITETDNSEYITDSEKFNLTIPNRDNKVLVTGIQINFKPFDDETFIEIKDFDITNSHVVDTKNNIIAISDIVVSRGVCNITLSVPCYVKYCHITFNESLTYTDVKHYLVGYEIESIKSIPLDVIEGLEKDKKFNVINKKRIYTVTDVLANQQEEEQIVNSIYSDYLK